MLSVPDDLKRIEDALSRVFEDGGLLSKRHPRYEYRPRQLEMSRAVARALFEKKSLLVEAETGIGKTLAYLLPALLSGRKVVVSTGTKTLQSQIAEKDIPLVEALLENEGLERMPRFAVMKGRRNYLCLWRLEQSVQEGLFEKKDVSSVQAIRRWSRETVSGDISEFTGLSEDDRLWGRLTVGSENCLGRRCSVFEDCFVTRMRREAVEADLVVVNHHLYFSDLAVRDSRFGQVLPDHHAVIFDEAHSLEKIATGFFGTLLSQIMVERWLNEAERAFRPLVRAQSEDALLLGEALERCTREGARHFQDRAGAVRSTAGRDGETRALLPPHENAESYRAFLSCTAALLARMEGLHSGQASAGDDTLEREMILARGQEILSVAEFLAAQNDEAFVYYAELSDRNVTLRCAPVEVDAMFKERVFAGDKTVIMTSATMTVDGGFDFISRRLGAGDCDRLALGPQFDYENQAMIYLPKDLPEPRHPQWRERAAEEIKAVVECARGRTFVLCTSFESLNYFYDVLESQLDYPLFRQGEAPKAQLLESFRKDGHAVLFATSTFWEGVDVQGEALSAVVIDKLPFEVPTDPVTQARTRRLDREGKNAFMEYSVPQAAVMLKQGFGRLIRSKEDRGLLVLLDVRVLQKRYGKVFLRSLPKCPIIHSLDDAKDLFL